MKRATRGDLLVVEEIHSATGRAFDSTLRTTYSVGRVTSITREKMAKAVEFPSYSGSWHAVKLDGTGGYGRTWIDSKTTIDVAGVLEAVRAHHWPGHPDSPMPFDSLDEVRAVVRPFIRRMD